MAQQQSEIRYLTPPSVDVKKKKYCRFKKSGIKYIDYKDPEFLKKFLNEQGKILPRRITGTSLKFQRRIAQAVKRARHLASCNGHVTVIAHRIDRSMYLPEFCRIASVIRINDCLIYREINESRT